jgi:predicted nucleic acid-binding protein
MKFGTVDPKDPLTQRVARYPHEHATPAEYSKSVEPHEPELFELNFWDALVTAVALVAVAGVLAILIVEW